MAQDASRRGSRGGLEVPFGAILGTLERDFENNLGEILELVKAILKVMFGTCGIYLEDDVH